MDKDTLLYADVSLLRSIAKKLNIDIFIYYETLNNKIVKTRNLIDKSILIDKILDDDDDLIIYRKDSVSFKPQKLCPNSLVLFNEYSTTNKSVNQLLNDLSDNNFKHGQTSFYIVRKYWRENKPLTYKKLVELYFDYLNNPLPEITESCHYNNSDKKLWIENKLKAIDKIINYYDIE